MQSPQYDWVRRGIRTFLQAFLGSIILLGFPIATSFINAVNSGQEAALDINVGKRILIAALFAGVMSLVSFLHNFLEDNTAMPAVLKSQPSSGVNPAPDPGGSPDPNDTLNVPREQWGINRRNTPDT